MHFDSLPNCTQTGPGVPAGKRFVAEHINGNIASGNELDEYRIRNVATGLTFKFAPRFVLAVGGIQKYVLNEPFLAYFGPDETPSLEIVAVGLSANGPVARRV